MGRKRADSSQKIDIVIPWVDPGDPVWQKDKAKYSGTVTMEEDDRDIRYRDWDNLQYVFRSIDKYAPWVNKVHFITYGHLPKWLNTDCPKLHIVRHEDYIPAEYLPVFSSHVIELNMNRIEGLSEQFIYFNDDIFLIRPVKPEDFFRNGLPCDVNIPNLIVPVLSNFSPIVFNTVGIINRHFSKRQSMKKDPAKTFNLQYGASGMLRTLLFAPWGNYTGFYNPHVALSYLKSTLDEVWAAEPEILTETCRHRFRDNRDVNQYIFRFWQLASGRFTPYTLHGHYFKISGDNRRIIRFVEKKKYRMICINDDEFQGDFEKAKAEINGLLERTFPEKCSFEL
ncbi:MAG: Stealth CR1 domain-containing protein [Eubacteriales bacterium]|nr:Stealth CR1 domain-containing protein [Eubacteriales bacterium]